jgi:hypothetical protein
MSRERPAQVRFHVSNHLALRVNRSGLVPVVLNKGLCGDGRALTKSSRTEGWWLAMSARGWLAIQWALTVIVVSGLAVQAFVHFDLASAFKNVKSSTLSEPDLFHGEAIAAVVAAVALLIRPRRYTAAFAFLVAAAGTVAVVLYRYVDVGAFGPFPNMYDPFWAPAEKTLSAFAEGVAALAALALFVMFHIRTRRSTRGEAAVQVGG